MQDDKLLSDGVPRMSDPLEIIRKALETRGITYAGLNEGIAIPMDNANKALLRKLRSSPDLLPLPPRDKNMSKAVAAGTAVPLNVEENRVLEQMVSRLKLDVPRTHLVSITPRLASIEIRVRQRK